MMEVIYVCASTSLPDREGIKFKKETQSKMIASDVKISKQVITD